MVGNFAYAYKTKYEDLPGNCRMAYVDEGKGERTLLFIHGLANYALVWKKNIDYLKQYYRCIAIDLPGNGMSDKNPHPFSMDFFADNVYHFISALKLKNLTIVGHSMGGQVAITALIKYPQCAQSLILCAPAGFEEFTAMDKTLYHNAMHLLEFISSDENNLRKTIEHSFYNYNAQGETVIQDLVALMKTYNMGYYHKMIEACVKAMLDEAVHEKLHLVKQPVLVLFGNKDALIPNKLLHHLSTEKLATDAVKKMANAILKMLPDCGHFIQWEKADEVNKAIVAFVEAQE